MPKRLLIHIGYPKTGTTFLQSEYFPFLQSKDFGINYIPSRFIQSALELIMNGTPFIDNKVIILDLLEKYLEEDSLNIISQESLIGAVFYKSLNSKLIAKRLKEIFPHAHILISIRNQVDICRSLYIQYVQEGGHRKYADFYYSNEVNNPLSIDDQRVNLDTFKFEFLIKHYQSIFGQDNVSVLPFEQYIKDPICLTNKLINIFGNIHFSGKENKKKKNESLGKRQISIARRLNRIFYSHFNRSGIRTVTLQKILGAFPQSTLPRTILQNKWSGKILGKKKLTNQILESQIGAYFNESNISLERILGEKLPGKYYTSILRKKE